jgi:hypothetical protein
MMSEKISTYLYNDDYGDKVYLSLALRCGYAYRYAYIDGDEFSKELNQGFPMVLGFYIKRLMEQSAETEVHVATHRCATCFSIAADTVSVFDDFTRLYEKIFNTELNEEMFLAAKEDAITALKGAYATPVLKAFYHTLEFTDWQKAFSYKKYSGDLLYIDFDVFSELWNEFCRPDNAVLVLSGNPDLDAVQHELPLTNENNISSRLIFCAEAKSPEMLSDGYKVLPNTKSGQIRCMHFSFSEKVSLTERFLLLNILAGKIDGNKREIHVDAFDASIVLLGEEKLPPKHELKKSLTEEFVEVAKARIFAQMDFDKKHSVTEFNSFWAMMTASGIELSQYIQMVADCTAESVSELFDRAGPIIANGAVVLQTVKVGKGV